LSQPILISLVVAAPDLTSVFCFLLLYDGDLNQSTPA